MTRIQQRDFSQSPVDRRMRGVGDRPQSTSLSILSSTGGDHKKPTRDFLMLWLFPHSERALNPVSWGNLCVLVCILVQAAFSRARRCTHGFCGRTLDWTSGI